MKRSFGLFEKLANVVQIDARLNVAEVSCDHLKGRVFVWGGGHVG